MNNLGSCGELLVGGEIGFTTCSEETSIGVALVDGIVWFVEEMIGGSFMCATTMGASNGGVGRGRWCMI